MISRSNLAKCVILTAMLALTINCSALAKSNKYNNQKSISSLKKSAVVAGSAVYADSLLKKADDNLKQEFSNIQVGNIPNPLGEIVLDKETIEHKLGEFAHLVEIPESITVKRLGTVLNTELVKAKIEDYCSENTDDCLSFDFSKLGSSIILPGNVISWDIKSNSSNELGMRLFAFEAETEAGHYRQLIQVNVSKTIEAAELCQLVKPGEVITEDMIRPVSVVIKNEKNNTAVSYKDVIGKTLDRFKSAGTIVRNSDIAKSNTKIVKTRKTTKIEGIRTPHALSMMATTMKNDIMAESWLIKPGEKVEYRVTSGALSLSIPAKAVQGGNSGDEIELINLKNKRRISGVITEKGVVEYAQK